MTWLHCTANTQAYRGLPKLISAWFSKQMLMMYELLITKFVLYILYFCKWQIQLKFSVNVYSVRDTFGHNVLDILGIWLLSSNDTHPLATLLSF